MHSAAAAAAVVNAAHTAAVSAVHTAAVSAVHTAAIRSIAVVRTVVARIQVVVGGAGQRSIGKPTVQRS